MKVQISHEKAYEIILSAIEDAKRLTDYKFNSRWASIRSVILGSHLTYRYILVTGLLAKATDNRANPLALQANAAVEGAYDARSLCHQVIVGKVENSFLEGKLGASNEPFLNKPARYLIHSSENPVRRGNDRILQQLSIDVLQAATTQTIAYEMLVIALFFTLQRKNRIITTTIIDFNYYETISLLISNPCDGESCAIASALSLYLIGSQRNWTVKAHPVNQAGSSSKEILDIDIYHDGVAFLAIEVKDKIFNYQDVNHAVSKAITAGLSKVIFLKGPRAISIGINESNCIDDAAKKGVSLSFSDVMTFATTCYALSPQSNNEEAINFLNEILKDIRAKDSTIEYIESLFKK
ncbi:restriction endonuclease, SacI family [Enterobacter ludwigii]